MKTVFYFALIFFTFSCNSSSNDVASFSSTSVSINDEILTSVKGANGKFNLDRLTIGNLHRLGNTVTNFRDIAKKRSPKIDIYNELATIISRNTDEILSQCKMKGDGQEQLKIVIDKISEQNKTIAETTDLEQAKVAFKNICNLTNQINTDFDLLD
jgi:hypothetical protein